MDRQTELELINTVKEGNYSRFGELVKEYQAPLATFIFRMVKSEDDARDLCQDVFFKAYRSLDAFRGDAKFSTWLFRIAYHLSLNFLKKNRGITQWGEERDAAADVIRSGEGEPWGKVEAQEMKDRVNKMLQEIPSRYALPLHLYYKEGLKYREISDILKRPLNTVKSDLLRGKEMLRERVTGTDR